MTDGRHREWGATPIYPHEWWLLWIGIGIQILIAGVACWALVVLQ